MRVFAGLVALGAVFAAPAAVVIDEAGELTPRSDKLQGGEYSVTRTVAVPAGQVLIAHLSASFDAYLGVVTPDGRQFDNDDSGGGTDSRVLCYLTDGGQARLLCTTAEAGQTGRYSLLAETWPLAGGPAAWQTEVRTGELKQGDETLKAGEFVDRLKLPVVAGEVLRLTLTSADFDAYLAASAPGHALTEYDDIEGTNAEVCVLAHATGEAEIAVTSSAAGETGRYRLTIARGRLVETARPSLLAVRGSLTRESEKLESGEYARRYEVPVAAGQAFEVELLAEGFGGYLITETPGVGQLDGEARGAAPARVANRATEAGQLAVLVTTARPGETGTYRLAVRAAAPGAQPTEPTTPPAAPKPRPTIGATVGGALTAAAAGEAVAQLYSQVRREGLALKPDDPLLRPSPPTPRSTVVRDPGLIGEVLYRFNRLSVEVNGKHTWEQTCQWLEGDQKRTSRCTDRDRQFRPDLFQAFSLTNVDALGWSYGAEPALKSPEADLKWEGDTFQSFRHVQNRDGWAVVAVAGRLSADGSVVEQLDLRTIVQRWTWPGVGEPVVQAQYWQGVGLVDVPLYQRVEVGDRDPLTGHADAIYPPTTLAKFLAALTTWERNRLPREGLYYGVIDSPDARDKILQLKHLSLEPYRGRIFELDNAKWTEYQETAWLDATVKPTIRIRFYQE